VSKVVYLGLGSNVGDREAELRRALRLMEGYDLRVKRVSSVYETAPMYETDQPPFLNAVAEATTTLFPVRLLLRLQQIERTMGRRRAVRNGPRNIDLDILLFPGHVVDTPTLRIPHPRLAERRFALEPLAELAPDLRHPVDKKTVAELLAAVPAAGVHRTDIRLTAPLDVGQK
jgi:2-amino-4-hydroxy-6-hydroxymethyldihydropteridine diphosphokinase